jgi:multiple sugar transport system substrate-binding protein
MLAAASNTRLVTWGPNTNVAFTAYTDAIGKAITNHTRLSEALDSVQQATVSDLKNRNYKVKD